MRKKKNTQNVLPVQCFLEQYLKAEEEIQSRKDHIASLRSIVENTTTHLSLTAGRNPSQNEYKFENSMINIVEEERQFAERLGELAVLQASVENLISRVKDPVHEKLLRYKYVEGLKMREIAEELNLSVSHSYVVLGKALFSADRVYREISPEK